MTTPCRADQSTDSASPAEQTMRLSGSTSRGVHPRVGSSSSSRPARWPVPRRATAAVVAVARLRAMSSPLSRGPRRQAARRPLERPRLLGHYRGRRGTRARTRRPGGSAADTRYRARMCGNSRIDGSARDPRARSRWGAAERCAPENHAAVVGRTRPSRVKNVVIAGQVGPMRPMMAPRGTTSRRLAR